MNHDPLQHQVHPKAFWGSRRSVGLAVPSAIALYFLLTKHGIHFICALPFLLLLACPLMHLFMHHDHGGHGGAEDRPLEGQRAPEAPLPLKPPGGAP